MPSILPIPAQVVKSFHRSLRGYTVVSGRQPHLPGFIGVLREFGGSALDVRWENNGVGVINGPPGGFVASYGFKKKLLPPTTTASCEGEGWGDRKPREPHRFPTVFPPDHHRTTSTTERHGANCHKTRPKPMNHHRPDYGRVMRAENPPGAGGLGGAGMAGAGVWGFDGAGIRGPWRGAEAGLGG